MAIIDVHGLHELSLNFRALEFRPPKVETEMLESAAEVLIKGQRETLDAYVRGYRVRPRRNGRPRKAVRTGGLSESLRADKPKIGMDESSITIRPHGTRDRDGAPYALIAWLVENGTGEIPPRPFMRDGNAKYEAEAVEAAAKVYNNWLESIGL